MILGHTSAMDLDEYARFLALLEKYNPSTLPLKVGSKIPAVRWKGAEPGTVWPSFPDTVSRALLTGRMSGGLVVLDVDPKDGGFTSLEGLEARHGALPATLTVRTPTGGLHLYLAGSQPFQTNASKIAPGLDIRAEGGIVVTPGSVHPSGGVYRMELD